MAGDLKISELPELASGSINAAEDKIAVFSSVTTNTHGVYPSQFIEEALGKLAVKDTITASTDLSDAVVTEEKLALVLQDKINNPSGETITISGADPTLTIEDTGAAAGEKELIVIENDLIKLTLSTKGGRPYSVQLKNYQTYDSLPLILFDGDSTVFGLNFFANNRSINTNELYFIPSREEKLIIVQDKPETISMRLSAGDDQYIDYVYTLVPGDYMVDFNLQFHNMQKILSERINFIDLNWEIYVPGHEQGRINELNYTTIIFRHYQDEVERFSPSGRN